MLNGVNSMQRRNILILSILSWCSLQPITLQGHVFKKNYKTQFCRKSIKKQPSPCILEGLGEIFCDAGSLLKNLFSVSSAKVITSFIPLYVLSRVHDEKIQANFYDPSNHKNINQFPKHCHSIAHYGIGFPIVALSSLAFFANDEDLRLTGRMFAIGLPFVHSGKDIIKKLRFKSCLRPWHENFDRHHRSSGGFPSGHMANVMFMASLFGMRHGPAWGVSLGLFAGFVFVDFVNCNRHYFSQLVAGAGLGLIFALAASKVVDKKLSERCSFSCNVDAQGNSCAQLCYRF